MCSVVYVSFHSGGGFLYGDFVLKETEEERNDECDHHIVHRYTQCAHIVNYSKEIKVCVSVCMHRL